MIVTAQHFLDNCPVEIWPGHFGVAKAKYVPETFVAVFRDLRETTVVAKEEDLDEDWALTDERDWRLLSFRVGLPFELTGFLAVVSQALADQQTSIFALSAYSTDHILVKQADFPKAVRCLQSLGCTVKELP